MKEEISTIMSDENLSEKLYTSKQLLLFASAVRGVNAYLGDRYFNDDKIAQLYVINKDINREFDAGMLSRVLGIGYIFGQVIEAEIMALHQYVKDDKKEYDPLAYVSWWIRATFVRLSQEARAKDSKK